MVYALRVAAVAAAATAVAARPEFASLIPNGMAHNDAGSGLTCDAFGHTDCVPGGPRNAFGLDFKAAGFQWTKELCEKDSDGDSLTNGQELGDPCCLWTPDNANPKGFRVVNLSHPGMSSDDGAKGAPTCEEATAPAEGAAPAEEEPIVEPSAPVVDAKPKEDEPAPVTEAPEAAPVTLPTTASPTTVAEEAPKLPLCDKPTLPNFGDDYVPYPRTEETKDKILLLKVDAGQYVNYEDAGTKILEDGEYICPGDYPIPWGIICDPPKKPDGFVNFEVDGEWYHREGEAPYSIAADMGGLINEWSYESGPIVLRCYTEDGNEVSASITLGCEDTASATVPSPVTTMAGTTMKATTVAANDTTTAMTKPMMEATKPMTKPTKPVMDVTKPMTKPTEPMTEATDSASEPGPGKDYYEYGYGYGK